MGILNFIRFPDEASKAKLEGRFGPSQELTEPSETAHAWFGLPEDADLEDLTAEFDTDGVTATHVSSSEALQFSILRAGKPTYTAEFDSDSGWYLKRGRLPAYGNTGVIRCYLAQREWFDKGDAAYHMVDAVMGGTLGAHLLPDRSTRGFTVWLDDGVLEELARVERATGHTREVVLTSAWKHSRKQLYKIAREEAGHPIRTPRSRVEAIELFERRKQAVPALELGERRKVSLDLAEEFLYELQLIANEADRSTGWALRLGYLTAREYLAILATPGA